MEINEAKQKIDQLLSIIKELSGKPFEPADINVIEKFEKENGIELPEIYKYFLLKCDGIYAEGLANPYQCSSNSEDDSEELFTYYNKADILSISELIEKYSLMREYAQSPIPKEIIPYQNEPWDSGGLFCVDVETGDSFEWYHETGNISPHDSFSLNKEIILQLRTVGILYLYDSYQFMCKKLREEFDDLGEIYFEINEDKFSALIGCDDEKQEDVLKFVRKEFKDYESEISVARHFWEFSADIYEDPTFVVIKLR